MRRIALLVLLVLPTLVSAQYQFRSNTDIPVTLDDSELMLPWTGGLNSAQFLKFDLNHDGTEDLVIYHRISKELTTFLAINNEYVFNADYPSMFPPEVEDWLILKDYDCDGLKDIFTSTPFGIKVFRNITTGDRLQWEEAADFLRFDSGINLQVNASDIPGIEDIDGDGDLDILSYRFSTASTIDYYKNTSIETTGECGALTFIRETRIWGGFEECNCNDIVFGGVGCNPGGIIEPEEPQGIQQIEHAGGKTVLPLDIDGDGDMDLITSDEFCETLYFMENVGDSDNAVMTSFVSFPEFAPAGFFIFPSAFYEDFDFDGVKDLVISSNSDQNLLNQIDFRNNVTIYRNNGTNTAVDFQPPSPFLQNQMIDLGETTFPTLGDIDGDGDLDLLVGNRGNYNGSEFVANLFLFENTGSRLAPEFELTDSDYLNLGGAELRNIKPQLVDLDGDQDLDLTYFATNTSNQPALFYRLNSASSDQSISLGEQQTISLSLDEDDQPYFSDINGDGQIDLLVGNPLGALELYTNSGGLNFTLASEEFAGIGNNFDRRNVSAIVHDIDNDGTRELITSDNSGEIRIHSGELSASFEPDSISTNIAYNSISSYVPTTYGVISPMAFGDLTGSGLPELIVGNNRGGFYYLDNNSERGNTTGLSAIRVEVFPNPARETFFVRTDVSSTLEIYAMTGQRVNSGIEINGNSSIEISLSGLSPGIYLIRAFNGTNRPTVKRIIVER